MIKKYVMERWQEILRRCHILHIFGGDGIKYIFYYKRLTTGKRVREKTLKLHYYDRPFWIRIPSTDIFLVETILVGNLHKKEWKSEYYPVIEKLDKISSNCPVIIDCGANIGLFSLLVSSMYPQAKIIAVEPEEANYEMLRRNLSSQKDVVLLKRGVWSKNCKLSVQARGTGEWGFKVVEDVNGDVEAISIADIIRENNLSNIDVLKMDIEGSEFNVFTEGELVWLDICKMLVIETHEDIVKGVDGIVNKSLTSWGFCKETMGENQVFYKLI